MAARLLLQLLYCQWRQSISCTTSIAEETNVPTVRFPGSHTCPSSSNVFSLVRLPNIPLRTVHCTVQQSAYRRFHSAETALQSAHNDFVHSIDNGKVSLVVLLVVSAPFDTVDHQLLSSVLANRISVDSTAVSWFESIYNLATFCACKIRYWSR